MHLFTCETAKPFEELVRGSQTVVEILWERSFGILICILWTFALGFFLIVDNLNCIDPPQIKAKVKKEKMTNDDDSKCNVDPFFLRW